MRLLVEFCEQPVQKNTLERVDLQISFEAHIQSSWVIHRQVHVALAEMFTRKQTKVNENIGWLKNMQCLFESRGKCEN